MFAHKTALLSAITTALLASVGVQAAEPLKAVGAGEGPWVLGDGVDAGRRRLHHHG